MIPIRKVFFLVLVVINAMNLGAAAVLHFYGFGLLALAFTVIFSIAVVSEDE